MFVPLIFVLLDFPGTKSYIFAVSFIHSNGPKAHQAIQIITAFEKQKSTENHVGFICVLCDTKQYLSLSSIHCFFCIIYVQTLNKLQS